MNVYIYAANIYCKDCGEAIVERLDREDIGDFPSGPYSCGGGESDSPQHCGAGSDCLNAIKLSDETKVGAWLENELTVEGVEYVRDAIREGGEIAELWADFYSDQLEGD